MFNQFFENVQKDFGQPCSSMSVEYKGFMIIDNVCNVVLER